MKASEDGAKKKKYIVGWKKGHWLSIEQKLACKWWRPAGYMSCQDVTVSMVPGEKVATLKGKINPLSSNLSRGNEKLSLEKFSFLEIKFYF